MTFLQLALGYIIGRVIVSVLFIPAYFRGELFTSYELLQRRFGPAVKNIAAAIFLITRSLADGIRLFATALVIAVVTGVPVPLDDRRARRAMIVYTMRGGVSAVIWTDVVQMFVYVAGALLVFFALLQQIDGGWAAVSQRRRAPPASSRSSTSASIRPRVYTFWAGLVGGVALTLATHGTDQFLVQRLLSARSRSAAPPRPGAQRLHRLRAVRAVPGHRRDALHLLPADAAAARRWPRNDEILPLFVVTSLPHGAAGFIVAAIVAAALSPSINAMAATTVNDFYLKYVRPDADQATLMRVSKRGDDRLGHRADRRRARRAVDPLGARRRAGGAVARRRPGARRVPRRRAHDARRSAGDARRHGRRHRRAHLRSGGRRRPRGPGTRSSARR